MALDIPDNTQALEDRIKADVRREAQGSNPYLKQSVILALIVGFVRRIYDFYKQLQILALEAFWDTSTGESLERQASWYGVTRNPATQSGGNVVATGSVGATISAGVQLQNSDGALYDVESTVVISDQAYSVTSLTWSGGTATATLADDISITSNTDVTISGANEAGYNGVHGILPTGPNEFTYEIDDPGAPTATGTITAGFTLAVVPVESVDFGQTTNLDFDSPLTFTSPITSVDDEARVDWGAVGGGTDQETDEELRDRFLERVQNPVAHFNSADITQQAKTVPGVTKVWVEEITPAVGQVTIYFIRGNDDDVIPTAGEVDDVKDAILEITPANTAPSDVFVLAPTPVSTDFTFTALVPNTPTMQSAIQANLDALFRDETNVSVALTEIEYTTAIKNTIDPETGSLVQTFTLSAPSGDIGGGAGELPTLGAVNF